MENMILAVLLAGLSTTICACKKEGPQSATRWNASDSPLQPPEPARPTPAQPLPAAPIVQTPPYMEQPRQSPSMSGPLPLDGPEQIFGTPSAHPSVAARAYQHPESQYSSANRSPVDDARQRRIDEALQRSRRLHTKREAADAAAVGAGTPSGLERATEAIHALAARSVRRPLVEHLHSEDSEANSKSYPIDSKALDYRRAECFENETFGSVGDSMTLDDFLHEHSCLAEEAVPAVLFAGGRLEKNLKTIK